jgi:hypothetical protein
MLEMLNRNNREDMKGECEFVKHLGKSVAHYALMCEGISRRLVDFWIGKKIVSSLMPLTITIRSILLDLEEYRDLTVVKRTHRLCRYKCAESLKLVFMDTLKDKSGVLCIYGRQFYYKGMKLIM